MGRWVGIRNNCYCGSNQWLRDNLPLGWLCVYWSFSEVRYLRWFVLFSVVRCWQNCWGLVIWQDLSTFLVLLSALCMRSLVCFGVRVFGFCIGERDGSLVCCGGGFLMLLWTIWARVKSFLHIRRLRRDVLHVGECPIRPWWRWETVAWWFGGMIAMSDG